MDDKRSSLIYQCILASKGESFCAGNLENNIDETRSS